MEKKKIFFSRLPKLIIIFYLTGILIFKKLLKENENNIYEPILPSTLNEYIVKKYHKSKFNLNQNRYKFQSIFEQRKIFRINYNYFPYKKINKSILYDECANYIYKSTGMLNITKLDYYYKKINLNILSFNHIHLSMAFDQNYIDLSTISIASILNTSSPNTYIHFHILCLNFNFHDMKKIIRLKSINKNVEFVFYNAKQAIYDFGEVGKNARKGIGNYAKILAPQIVNNTNRILVLDSGDIIAQKDISEIYFYDLEDNYFAWILGENAGNEQKKYEIFYRNNFYPNSGICLINVRLFRKDNLYKKAFFFSKSYKNLFCPHQDILISISIYKFKYFPLKYNCKRLFDYDNQIKNKNKIRKSQIIKNFIFNQKSSPYKYSLEEILEAVVDPVINHFYLNKIYESEKCNRFTFQWIKYSKLTGLYNEIKKKYPKPFKNCETILKNK